MKLELKFTSRKLWQFFLIALSLLLSDIVLAQQNIQINDKIVSSENGSAIAGVSVSVNEHSRGVISAEDGSYSIDTLNGSILTVSSIDFELKGIIVSGNTKVEVTMTPTASQLSDVIVIGCGTQKLVDVTSSVVSVNEKNIVRVLVQDSGQLLREKVVGLTISSLSGNPTSGTQIIRG